MTHTPAAAQTGSLLTYLRSKSRALRSLLAYVKYHTTCKVQLTSILHCMSEIPVMAPVGRLHTSVYLTVLPLPRCPTNYILQIPLSGEHWAGSHSLCLNVEMLEREVAYFKPDFNQLKPIACRIHLS